MQVFIKFFDQDHQLQTQEFADLQYLPRIGEVVVLYGCGSRKVTNVVHNLCTNQVTIVAEFPP